MCGPRPVISVFLSPAHTLEKLRRGRRDRAVGLSIHRDRVPLQRIASPPERARDGPDRKADFARSQVLRRAQPGVPRGAATAEIAKSARRGRSTPASSGGKMPPTGEAVMTTDATSFVELLHSRNGLRRSRRHRGRGARRGDGDAIRALAAQRRRGARGALRPTPALDLRDAPRQARRDHSDLDELPAERPIDAELTDHTRFRPDLPGGATGKLQRIGLARRGLA